MIVISDTTPVISLMKASYLDLLQKLYGNVLIPNAVYRELTENPIYSEEAEIIRTCDFLRKTDVENTQSVHILRSVTGLDIGESEALVMYDEQNADLLLMDERKGRNVAKQLNVKYIGTVGILMVAFDKGFILSSEVKLCMDMMLANGIRLDEKLYNLVLEHIGMLP